MEKARHSVRFEAEVDGKGMVTFSRHLPSLQLKPGTKVTVKIFGAVLSKRLSGLGVTESEIESIGEVQFEDREHVMSFLASQGSLNGNTGFAQRLKRITA